MMTCPMTRVIQHIRKRALLDEGADLADGQLLESFVKRRDTAALEVLVQRHAPMVWGVCRRILANHHDAEDAFQATFLVLVRKAATVVPREMVASWLYGVARQNVLKARATTALRQRRERQVTTMPEAGLAHDTKNDLQPVLDEELHRLPDMYRVAIILCDLEGKTRKEAARQLGCPEGTLTARLARGRTMLAKRIAGRGVALSGGALAALLTPAATAGVPSSVLSSTIKAVTLLAAGQAAAGQISVKVAALTEAVIRAMLLTKLTNVIVGLLVVAVAVVGFGGGWGGGTLSWTVAAGPALHAVADKAAPQADSDQDRTKEDRQENPDLSRLQGTWAAVAAEANGKQLTDSALAQWKFTLEISGDRFTATADLGENGQVLWKGKVKLDTTKKPPRFDVPNGRLEFPKTKGVMTAGGIEGIYELAGDSLKICYGPQRPAQFKTKPDSAHKLYVFERQKPKKSDKKSS